MKKQVVLGMLLSLAMTPVSFAAGAKGVKDIQKSMSEAEKDSQKKNSINVLNGVKAAELIDTSASNLGKISPKADTSALKSALARKVLAPTEGGDKSYDLMDIAKVLMKADQEVKEINRNELSGEASRHLVLIESAIKVSAEFLALANRTSDMKTNLTPQVSKEVAAFNMQLSLIPEILRMESSDIQAHLEIMAKAVSKRADSPNLNGDQAFAAAVKEGKSQEEYLAKLEEILKCLRLKSI